MRKLSLTTWLIIPAVIGAGLGWVFAGSVGIPVGAVLVPLIVLYIHKVRVERRRARAGPIS
jgi:hypothetical protein